jgi:nicotinate-nucleotide adenylyltransferase
MKVGLLGGSFDPIHMAHLVMAETALDLAGLDRVVFMVSAKPPHKLDRRLAPSHHRVAMARLATRGRPAFAVDDRELHRFGPSFTIDTVREVMADLPAGDELAFIIGADSLPELVLWRDIEALLDLVPFIIAARPGHDIAGALCTLGPRLGRDRVRALEAGVVAMPLLDISSTDIRRRIGEGRFIRYLVPHEVAEYIAREGLYRVTP